MENSSSWGNSPVGFRTLWVTVAPVVQDGVQGLGLPLQVFFCVAMVCVLLLAFLGNVVVCVMVYRRAAMRSAINILLASLAFSDMMLALLNMPFALVTVLSMHWVFGTAFCRMSAMFLWLFLLQGAAVLLIISVDRFLIIVQKQDRLSPGRAKALVAVSWTLSLFLAFPLSLGFPSVPAPPRAPQCVFGFALERGEQAYVVLMVLVFFFVPFSVMLYAFVGILCTLRRNALRIHSAFGSDSGKVRLAALRRPFHFNIDMSFKTRAFSTILVLFCISAVCWAPFVVFSLMSSFSGEFYSSADFFQISTWLLWLCYLKSALNPLVYYWRIRKFRDACLSLLPKRCGLLADVSGPVRRRIRPSTVYACGDHRSTV
ncbi:probable G-protein coupled receptor 63 [Hoplias malabaricus]|uniref:probable G-protein coupled receptor 63 n=1 Tax=Hoplias malabaricus TaxID=27720 RepID=UPI003461C512